MRRLLAVTREQAADLERTDAQVEDLTRASKKAASEQAAWESWERSVAERGAPKGSRRPNRDESMEEASLVEELRMENQVLTERVAGLMKYHDHVHSRLSETDARNAEDQSWRLKVGLG